MTEIVCQVESASWIDYPLSSFRLAGWMISTGPRPARVVIVEQAGCRLGLVSLTARPDVAAEFPHLPSSLMSGFELVVTPMDASSPIVLLAGLEDDTLAHAREIDLGSLSGGIPPLASFPDWCSKFDPDPVAGTDEQAGGPLFSILLPVFRTPVELLRRCLNSVRCQHYRDWQLVVVDDGSNDPNVTRALAQAVAEEPRILLQTLSENFGIARATNVALAQAQGDYVVLLDHDDQLRPHALAELASRISTLPECDILYTDEDKVDPEGRRLLPLFKPAFSPEFLLGVMYIGHALCIRTSVARSVGGFDPAYDGIQDYEFFLRVMERTRRVGHVPRILYHWRQSPSSSALHGNVKGDMDARQVLAVRSHLARIGDARRAEALGGHRVRLHADKVPSWAPVVVARESETLISLLHAASTKSVDVLVVLSPDVDAPDDNAFDQVAALAALSDSACVAPVLVSREGRVVEAGCTWGPEGIIPLMRGFDPSGDGYNGSLRCNREVGAVSPRCFAIRRSVALETLSSDSAPAAWPEFLQRLSSAGLYHRVCAATHIVVTTTSAFTSANLRAAPEPDPYFNPHFDPVLADYTLAQPPRHYSSVALRWHIDVHPACDSDDGGVEIRGWCFSSDRSEVAVTASVGGLDWTEICRFPRPDVAAAYPGVAPEECGFAIRLRLGPGKYHLRLIARAATAAPQVVLQQSVRVPSLAGLHRWLLSPLPRLLRFQLPAGPTIAVRNASADPLPSVQVTHPRQPRLAIVTPSFNQARFIGEAMRSVLSQAGATVDYVVQDGGSSDGSAQLISRIAAALPEPGFPTDAPRLVNWSSEPDHGQADAIAKGFAKTSGGPEDLMAWINSDDFYLPGALGFVADWMARHPEVDVVYGHRILVDEQSREVGRWFLPKHDDEVLRLNDFVPQETMFWRRRIWDKVGGLDTSFQFAMDWDLLLRFQAAGAKIVRLPYFLACFRLHPAQKTSAAMHDIGQKEIDRLRTRTHGREISPEELENHPRLLRYLRRSAFIEWLWSLGIRAP